MGRKILIICVDGMGPAYLEYAETPHIDRLAREGIARTGKSVIPSVTNVNNVSIITGAPPSVHGITANYWIDRDTDTGRYMEAPEFLRSETLLQRAKRGGMSTCLLTSKKKLLTLLDADADYALAAEDGDEEMIRRIGPTHDIYSAEINLWLFRALEVVLRERRPDVTYCSTTDWVMHKYAPHEEPSVRHVNGLDAILGRIVEEHPDLELYLTADHGMSAKTRGVDLEKVLARAGIRARAVPIIKDRYVAHHGNLGGASYVYLETCETLGDALACLREVAGVEEVLEREEAASTFELAADRIGDLMALGDAETVFGVFDAASASVQVRSHGSRYESDVPIICHGARALANASRYRRNLDVVACLGIA